jgi:hypothetical protein
MNNPASACTCGVFKRGRRDSNPQPPDRQSRDRTAPRERKTLGILAATNRFQATERRHNLVQFSAISSRLQSIPYQFLTSGNSACELDCLTVLPEEHRRNTVGSPLAGIIGVHYSVTRCADEVAAAQSHRRFQFLPGFPARRERVDGVSRESSGPVRGS